MKTEFNLANLAFQLGGDAELIKTVAADADLTVFVESRTAANTPIDVAKILGENYSVSQNLSNAAMAGTVIVVNLSRKSRLKIRWSILQVLSKAGHKVQTRYLRIGAFRTLRDGKTGRIAGVHIPLKSTGRQEAAVRKLKRWVKRQRRLNKRWMVIGDFNMKARELARLLDAPYYFGEDVMGFVCSEGWDIDDFDSKHLEGSDHAILKLTTNTPDKKVQHELQ